MSDKIYAPVMIKERKTSIGDILKFSFQAEKMIEFCKQHQNATGYVNLDILRRREASEYGETHYATLDTWKPTAKPQVNQDELP